MPPKGSRKRSRSPSSGSANKSRESGSGRRSPPSAASPASLHTRDVSEWETLHDRAVLALKPTAEMLAHCLAMVSPSKGVQCIKVAAFDLDDTLIMPKTGKVFPKDDADDWRWLTAEVPSHLRGLHERGFLLVILSNQSGLFGKGTWNQAKADALQQKIVRLSQAAQIPLSCFFSTQSASVWRKPGTGLWGALQEAIEAAAPSVASRMDCNTCSFYVGDAAGRHATTLAGRKKDFSCSDRALAVNLSLPFFTPEQFFLSPLSDIIVNTGVNDQRDGRLNALWADRVHALEKPEEIHWDTVSPEALRAMPTTYDNLAVKVITHDGESTITTGEPASFARLEEQEIILFVGYPGCGKSTFFRRFFQPHGYVHINRDTLKTKEKCFSVAQSCWQGGKSVVIDNTNPSAADRAFFARIAHTQTPKTRGGGGAASASKSTAIRVFEFVASRGVAAHMNAVRSRLNLGLSVPTIAYNLFQSRHEPVTSVEQVRKEGLTAAVLIPPVADFDGLPPAVRSNFFIL